MSIRRRSTAAVGLTVAAALALSACSSEGGGKAGDSAKSAGGDKKAAVATGGKDFGDAAKKTAGYGTDAPAGQFPRTLTHAMGKTELKSAPKRVVVLDVGEFDNVVSLGVKPVGYAPSEGDEAIPSYLKKDAGNPKNVGTINSLNLEAIAGLKPDLILGSQLRAADKYDQLSKIAPTVFSIRPGFTWKENYLLNAAALDRTAKAKSQLDAYEKKAAKLGEDIGPDKPTISMVRYLPDRIRLYAKASFIGTILEDAGLPRPKNQQIDDLATEISPEKIDEADADWIFTGVYGDPKATKRDTAQSNPLWKNLKAVKEGRAKDVADETWYLGLGVTAANLVLDDLRADLVK
ncbi:iron-siderophore ABC transporter substrate-binding protein [Streptomyces sp. NPDC005969]|uniref:ABC transporter substrate-binding protein n=1 Tax=Streptomyces sp. NPDC005969 TaxID=3156722 RepID=UPI0033BFF660